MKSGAPRLKSVGVQISAYASNAGAIASRAKMPADATGAGARLSAAFCIDTIGRTVGDRAATPWSRASISIVDQFSGFRYITAFREVSDGAGAPARPASPHDATPRLNIWYTSRERG